MKNKAINGLVAIILGLIFIEAVPYVSVGLTIYGLWLASKVLQETNVEKKNRIIAIIVSVIGYPLIVILFIIFFKSIFN